MFPLVPPSVSGTLELSDGHSVYWEESGNPLGIPAVYLHGGPGGGLGKRTYLTRFDPAKFRVIGLDQRGCGRSRPLANDPKHDLDQNTTPTLIDDLEVLRGHLGVDSWVLNGVSWGSTLALAYALAHPDRVQGIVLVAVTTGHRSEIDWITEQVGAIYPEGWDRLAASAEEAGVGFRRGAGRIVETYAALVRDPATRASAVRAWTKWADTHVAIGAGGFRRDPRWQDRDFAECFAILVTHYWSQDVFMDPPILDRVGELHGIPGILVHGRLDVSSPLVTAWRLHRLWPCSELVVDEGDGHGGKRMGEAWVDANSRLANLLA